MISRFFIALRAFGFGQQRAIPGLDGLRAISITLVLIAHLNGTRGFPVLPFLPKYLGEFGVRIFFVISGYLITAILLGEMRRTGGNIALPRFYFRRTMRLFPASYFLIVVVAIFGALGWVRLERWDLLAGVTYAMNYYESRGWALGHLWSLAVEEQFYLLWPLTLRTLKPGRATRLLLLIIAVVPVLRMVQIYVTPLLNFAVWADALATGCLLAILRDDLRANATYLRILGSRWFFLVPGIAFAGNYTPSTKVYWLISETVMNVAIALSADWAMRNTGGFVGRVLNLPAVGFAGVLSYSLYLWQQIFLDRSSSSPYCAFPLNILLVFVMAMFSYLAIEAPFLRLRTAMERIRAPREPVREGAANP